MHSPIPMTFLSFSCFSKSIEKEGKIKSLLIKHLLAMSLSFCLVSQLHENSDQLNLCSVTEYNIKTIEWRTWKFQDVIFIHWCRKVYPCTSFVELWIIVQGTVFWNKELPELYEYVHILHFLASTSFFFFF